MFLSIENSTNTKLKGDSNMIQWTEIPINEFIKKFEAQNYGFIIKFTIQQEEDHEDHFNANGILYDCDEVEIISKSYTIISDSYESAINVAALNLLQSAQYKLNDIVRSLNKFSLDFTV